MEIIEIPEYNSMDIFSPKGTKIVFSAGGGVDSDIIKGNKFLEIGKEYTVSKVKVSDWFSFVTLEEFPDEEFNTAMFTNSDKKQENS